MTKMPDLLNSIAPMTIAAVERDTGVSKDTLRVWEKRYGFPVPDRDANGERLYTLAQVEKLRLIKRLLDNGLRPGKIMAASAAELSALLEHVGTEVPVPRQRATQTAELLELLKGHRGQELRAALQQLLMRNGLEFFVVDIVAPMNRAIGEAWLRGEIEVHEEHAYSEQVQNVLRGALQSHGFARQPPKVLLTTFPEEEHAIGLLMVEAMLVSGGATTVSLGTRTPLPDIRSAALATGADVVALSFSAAYPVRQAIAGLTALRGALPGRVQVWAGGEGVKGRARQLPGIRLIGPIDEVPAALAEWREAHARSTAS